VILAEPPKRLKAQSCPFCGSFQDVIVNGHYPNPAKPDGAEIVISKDLGYSFCNCKNVFFTDWLNIELGTYNDQYVQRYQSPQTNALLRRYVSHFWPYFHKAKSILDIGAVNDGILDEARDRGLAAAGWDIAERESRHPMIFGNFETKETDETFDLITASHIFEHFKDPIAALEKCHRLLNPGGRIFIAMPDPFFINWANPYTWGHWHVREHHIMWDLDSFANEMTKAGFRVLFKRHNIDMTFICNGDFHISGEKV